MAKKITGDTSSYFCSQARAAFNVGPNKAANTVRNPEENAVNRDQENRACGF